MHLGRQDDYEVLTGERLMQSVAGGIRSGRYRRETVFIKQACRALGSLVAAEPVPGALFGALFGALADEIDRVDRSAVLQHFEVEVRAGGTARVAHQRDGLAFPDLVADGDQIL